MVAKNPLTNEKVSKKFKSQFELVNYAIKLAENMIKTGRESRVKMESQNRALQVLGEIVEGKDKFDELPPAETYEAEEGRRFQGSEERRRFDRTEEGRSTGSTKNSERKKTRKILAS